MTSIEQIPALLDPYFITLFRITGYAILDFMIGTFALALAAVVVGEFTLSVVMRLNRRHLASIEAEMLKEHDLSMKAIELNDETGYRACNKQANDAFGKYFFNIITYSAACLWPIPFVLSWMQMRFVDVTFPLIYPISLVWSSTGYFTIFLAMYVLARILFKNLRCHLPYFRGVQEMLDGTQKGPLPATPPSLSC